MEIEIPVMLRAREALYPDKFSFHSACRDELNHTRRARQNERQDRGDIASPPRRRGRYYRGSLSRGGSTEKPGQTPGRKGDMPSRIEHGGRSIPFLSSAVALRVDALAISACVRMPSLRVIDTVESEAGIPVLSAATATTCYLLKMLGLETGAPGAGALLSGKY
jgi:hypothetical protein